MRLLTSAVLLCLPLAAQTPQTNPPKTPPKAAVEVGKPAPTARVNNEAGTLTLLGGPEKTWTVLAFYPKASTGG